MPAEILREREDLPTDPGPPPPASPGRPVPPESPGFAELAAATTPQIEAARQARLESSGRQREAMVQQQEAMRPVFERTQQMLAEPRPTPPPRPELPEAPSRGLHQFLAPVQGEPPENTITKLINGIGLMAGGFTGLARGDARAALAGLTGAMTGWHQGDKERADRGFSDWQAATGRLLKDWDLRHQEYRDILENKKMSVEQQMKALQLKLLETGQTAALEQGIGQDLDRTLGWYDGDRKLRQDVSLGAARIQQGYDLAALDAKLARDKMAQAERFFTAKQATDAAAKSQAEPAEVDRLRDDFMKAAGPFVTIRDSFQRVLASAQQPSAAGDLAMIFNYMKMLDPGSVIRESEFAQAASSGSYGDRIQAMVNRALTGERLADPVRKDFVDRAQRLFTESLKTQQELEGQFRGLAKQRGIEEARAVPDVVGRLRTPEAATGPKTMLIRRKGAGGAWEYAEGPVGAVPAGWERHDGR